MRKREVYDELIVKNEDLNDDNEEICTGFSFKNSDNNICYKRGMQ